jgi:hypothetical protein
MKRLFFLLALVLIAVSLSGQTSSDSILVKKRLGPVFQQNGRNLTPNQLLNITKTNPDAYSEMKKANSNYMASMVFQLPGGFLIGYPLGTAVAGGDPNWTLAAIGAGLVVISIPLISGYNKHATRAVSIYNKGLASYNIPVSYMSLGFTTHGIGFKFRF